jgi:IMP dehydrogenase
MRALLRDIANRVLPLEASLTVGQARMQMPEGRDFVPLARAGRVVGCVSTLAVQTADGDLPLLALAAPVTLALEGHLPIREAANQFQANNTPLAWVTEQGEYLGFVTAQDFLSELGRSFDTLTSLRQSDTLREWGERHLEAGHEITILFIDLNDFKLYNKRFGHVVGDRVLKALAQRLLEVIDPQRDVVVRYGGDEFAIGTTLERGEAERLASAVAETPVMVEGVPLPVGFSVGIAGGRRHGRTAEHGASQVDDLINAASRDSLRRKNAQKERRTNLAQALEAALQQTAAPAEHVQDLSLTIGPDGTPAVELVWTSTGQPVLVRKAMQGDLVATIVAAIEEARRNGIRLV